MEATDLAFAGAAAQARALRARDISARELAESTLARIERYNPRLNAYRVVFAEQALAAADAAQEALDAGDERPLLGVPVAIKDDADVAGEVTTMGTLAHGPAPQRDGEVVRRLRAAGATIIGKTQVPALTHSPYTESLAFGATRNPWSLDHTPGGSSGGTGAAVAAGLAAVGLGSDGGGSIRIPATWCGLYGIKPQRNRIPLEPYDDGWQGMAHYGPLARTVEDAALFLDATADGAPDGGYVAAAATAPGKLRIAVSTKLPPGAMAPIGSAQRRAVEQTVELMRSLGHEVVERDPDYANDLWASVFARILRGIDDQGRALPHPERIERRVRGIMRLGHALPDSVVRWARGAELEQALRVDALFDDVDVLLTPGTLQGPYRVGDHSGYGTARWAAVASMRIAAFPAFNLTGQPACVVPSGVDADGLPLSVQLVSRRDGEATLLSLSAQLESERPWADRRPPLA